jgi:hypothetical protein
VFFTLFKSYNSCVFNTSMFTLLHTLINFTSESTVSMNKITLTTVLTCLQVMHIKVDVFKFQNKLLFDELSLLRHQLSDLILLQHIPLIGLPMDSKQECIEYVPTINQIKEFDVNDEDELQGDTQIRDEDTQVNNELKKHEDKLDKVTENIETYIMTDIAKDDAAKIIRPWKELQLKRNRYGLRYEKDGDNLFHILDYCKPITFVGDGFLDDDKEQVLNVEQVQDVVAIRDDQDGDDDANVDAAKDDQDVEVVVVNVATCTMDLYDHDA